MRKLSVVVMVVGLLVTMPIGFYLQFRILQGVEATNVMWLLFWVNMPVGILLSVLTKIIESEVRK